jgi:hypothetical protein
MNNIVLVGFKLFGQDRTADSGKTRGGGLYTVEVGSLHTP